MAMVFYLILSESMTAFSHFKLISSQSNVSLIRGQLEEKNNSFIIEFENNLALERRLKSSKLINYLMKLEGLVLEMTEVEKSILECHLITE